MAEHRYFYSDISSDMSLISIFVRTKIGCGSASNGVVLSVDRLLPEYAGWRKEDEKNAEKEVGGSTIKNARLRIGSCQNEPRNPF